MRRQAGATLALALVLAACGGQGGETDAESRTASEGGGAPAEGRPSSEGPAAGEERPGVEAEGARAEAGAGASLTNPSAFDETAPGVFRARFRTSAGDFVVEVHREWAPNGADRFYNLVTSGFYDGNRFFRVLEGFVAQWGIHGDPEVAAAWSRARIPDDPVDRSNVRGTLTFATAGPDTRTTQVFINYRDNARLDDMGFAPIGEVVEGMEVVDDLHAGYGEGAPQGEGPAQARIRQEGNAYLDEEFPRLDHIEGATIVSEGEGSSDGT